MKIIHVRSVYYQRALFCQETGARGGVVAHVLPVNPETALREVVGLTVEGNIVGLPSFPLYSLSSDSVKLLCPLSVRFGYLRYFVRSYIHEINNVR